MGPRGHRDETRFVRARDGSTNRTRRDTGRSGVCRPVAERSWTGSRSCRTRRYGQTIYAHVYLLTGLDFATVRVPDPSSEVPTPYLETDASAPSQVTEEGSWEDPGGPVDVGGANR